MKSLWILPLLLLTLVLLVGCKRQPDNPGNYNNTSTANTLTNDKVQRALNRWIGKMGSFTIKGIQELPQQNAAKVDITADLAWDEQYIGKKYYKGPGTAILTHYTDGRWALTEVGMTGDALADWRVNIPIE